MHLPAGLGKIRSIAVADHHGCAVKEDGMVWCWGANPSGARGDADKEPRAAAAQVAGISGAAQLSVNAERSCARLQDGEVWCWGDPFSATGPRQDPRPVGFWQYLPEQKP